MPFARDLMKSILPTPISSLTSADVEIQAAESSSVQLSMMPWSFA
jgi:hypothetical protein